MKSYIIIFLSLFVVLNIGILHGQTNTNKTEYIAFDVDYASFRAQDGLMLLEVYFLVSRSEFKFNKEEEKFASRHTIEIDLFRNDTLIVNLAIKIKNGQFITISGSCIGNYVHPILCK